jgi:hypothetical protein
MLGFLGFLLLCFTKFRLVEFCWGGGDLEVNMSLLLIGFQFESLIKSIGSKFSG